MRWMAWLLLLVGPAVGLEDLVALESGPLLPSVLPAPEAEALPTPLALASPERSTEDHKTFQMATNYLKAQFAMPHHTVPTLEDTLQASPERRRLSVARA